MGALKDIVDLCIQLRNEVSDGRVTEALTKIQSFTLALQSEQVALVEKNAELVAENLTLKNKISDFEKEIKEINAEKAQPPRRFLDDYEFDARKGIYRKKPDDGLYYCPKCIQESKAAPMQTRQHGWRCNSCGAGWEDPDNRAPSPYSSIKAGPRIPRIF